LEAIGATPISSPKKRGGQYWEYHQMGIDWTFTLKAFSEGVDCFIIEGALPLSTDSEAKKRHPHIHFMKKSPLSGLGEVLGLTYKHSSNTAELNRQFAFHCDPEKPEIQEFLQQPGVQNAILTLFDSNCMRLGSGLKAKAFPHKELMPHLIKNTSVLSGSWLPSGDWNKPEAIKSWLEELAKIINAFPPAREAPIPKKEFFGCATLLYASGILIVSFVLLITGSSWTPLESGLIQPALISFGLIFIAIGVVGYQICRRGNHKINTYVGMLGWGWATGLLAAGGLISSINGAFIEPTETHKLKVVKLGQHRSEGKTYYKLHFSKPDWVMKSLYRSISKEQYENKNLNATCALHYGEGRLGVRWKDKIHCTFGE